MAEQTVLEAPATTTTPIPAAETTQVVTPPAAPEVDLLTKVSQFKPAQDKAIVNPPEQPEFAAITDPVAKKAAQEAVERIRRGFQSDYTKKLEEAQRLVDQTKTWTPERIQKELLENPNFLQAAQMIAGNNSSPNDRPLTAEEYSSLTDSEKARLNLVPQLKNEINQLKKDNETKAIWTEINNTDGTLKSKYADYNPEQINNAFTQLAGMNAAQVREHIYKAQLHDEHVKAAYEMGKQEGKGLTQQKINVIAPDGTSTASSDGLPVKQKGESDQAFFVKLAQFRLAQSRKR
jgi:hypothetical protein